MNVAAYLQLTLTESAHTCRSLNLYLPTREPSSRWIDRLTSLDGSVSGRHVELLIVHDSPVEITRPPASPSLAQKHTLISDSFFFLKLLLVPLDSDTNFQLASIF